MEFAQGILLLGVSLTGILMLAEPFTRGRIGLLTGLFAVFLSIEVRLAMIAMPGLEIHVFYGLFFNASALALGPLLLFFSFRVSDSQRDTLMWPHFLPALIAVVVEPIWLGLDYANLDAKFIAAFRSGEQNLITLLLLLVALHAMSYFVANIYFYLKQRGRLEPGYFKFVLALLLLLMVGLAAILIGFLIQNEVLYLLGYALFCADAFFAILVTMKYPEFFYRLTQKNTRYSTISMASINVIEMAARIEKIIVENEEFRNSNLRVDPLARRLGLHRNQLSRIMNEHFGCSFNEYVNSHRIEAACEALVDTDDNVLDIAYESGFNSLSSFNSQFKKSKSVSPVAFRKAGPSSGKAS